MKRNRLLLISTILLAWSIGPSAVFLKMKGAWVTGAVISNVWSITEDIGLQRPSSLHNPV